MGDLTKTATRKGYGPVPLTRQFYESSIIGQGLKKAGLMSEAQYRRWVDPLGLSAYPDRRDMSPPEVPGATEMPAPPTGVASQVEAQRNAAVAARGRTGRLSTILSQNDSTGGTLSTGTGGGEPPAPLTSPTAAPTVKPLRPGKFSMDGQTPGGWAANRPEKQTGPNTERTGTRGTGIPRTGIRVPIPLKQRLT